jgi:flagellar biosynthetic protein FliQ
METGEVIEIATQAIFVLIKISLPLMAIALFVGLIISLFQALTQIQEMTLSFIPKIIAIFFSIIFFMSYMIDKMKDFSEELMSRIAGG